MGQVTPLLAMLALKALVHYKTTHGTGHPSFSPISSEGPNALSGAVIQQFLI